MPSPPWSVFLFSPETPPAQAVEHPSLSQAPTPPSAPPLSSLLLCIISSPLQSNLALLLQYATPSQHLLFLRWSHYITKGGLELPVLRASPSRVPGDRQAPPHPAYPVLFIGSRPRLLSLWSYCTILFPACLSSLLVDAGRTAWGYRRYCCNPRKRACHTVDC